MKAIVLAATATATIVAFPASAQVRAYGGSFAEGCYKASAAPLATLDAVTTCDRALQRETLSLDDQFAVYVDRGIVKMARDNFVDAQADFGAAVAMSPRRPEGWLNMAILRLRQGNGAAALPLFDKAIQLGTDVPEVAYYGRGLAYEDVGNIPAAYADLRHAAMLRPGWAEPTRDLARYRVRNQ